MEKKQPRIAFRYERELMTFYNRSVKKFFTVLVFVFLLINVTKLFREREEFIKELPYFLIAALILILFYYYIWRNTKKITKEYVYFTKDNTPRKGKIIDYLPVKDEKGKTHYRCKVKYKPKGSPEEREIMTPYVLGNPYELLRTLSVDVYEKNGETYVTGFSVAESLTDTPAYKKRKGK
ncbi:MAG: hypothetical protein Q4Q07_06610 [Tissierellia bacterium]|nr:hypothetical protein [Tissierellia bacterium]